MVQPSRPFDDRVPEKMWQHRDVWCAIYKVDMYDDTWNGYVLVPQGHPWRAFENYEDIPVAVHGGLTFGWECRPKYTVDDLVTGEELTIPERIRSGDDVGWWVGFDTCHAWDHDIDIDVLKRLSEVGDLAAFRKAHKSLRSFDYVVAETENLAAQVADAFDTWKRHEVEVRVEEGE